MEEMLQEIFDSTGLTDEGWEVLSESTLLTPNGHVIEWDGTSPDGEQSPALTLGLM
jgi:hypothetical protein